MRGNGRKKSPAEAGAGCPLNRGAEEGNSRRPPGKSGGGGRRRDGEGPAAGAAASNQCGGEGGLGTCGHRPGRDGTGWAELVPWQQPASSPGPQPLARRLPSAGGAEPRGAAARPPVPWPPSELPCSAAARGRGAAPAASPSQPGVTRRKRRFGAPRGRDFQSLQLSCCRTSRPRHRRSAYSSLAVQRASQKGNYSLNSNGMSSAGFSQSLSQVVDFKMASSSLWGSARPFSAFPSQSSPICKAHSVTHHYMENTLWPHACSGMPPK